MSAVLAVQESQAYALLACIIFSFSFHSRIGDSQRPIFAPPSDGSRSKDKGALEGLWQVSHCSRNKSAIAFAQRCPGRDIGEKTFTCVRKMPGALVVEGGVWKSRATLKRLGRNGSP
jgi:hypothetical protein